MLPKEKLNKIRVYFSRLYHLLKDFCGTVNEEALRVNSILVYEVLDEFMVSDRLFHSLLEQP